MIYFSSEYSEPASVNAGIIDTSDNLFVFTFLSSILSASFGMAKLLQAGPCRMVKLDSYGLGFLLIFLSALSGLMARGLNLGIMVTGKGHSSVNVCFYYLVRALFTGGHYGSRSFLGTLHFWCHMTIFMWGPKKLGDQKS